MREPGAGTPTGILGGTFNPIHLGHLRAAEEVREQLELERMLLVPSADPPLKRGGPEILAPARERLAWVRAAVADNDRLCVSDLELEREGPSYTVDTLRILGEQLPGGPPVFVIGHDAFVELPAWREPRTLLTLAHFAVVARPPLRAGRLSDWLPTELARDFELSEDGQSARHRSAGTWLRRLEIQGLEVSATGIRRRLREGLSVRYLVPEAARRTIEESGIYAARQ